MGLGALIDSIVPGEVEDWCPGVALQRNKRVLGLSERKARRPQKRGEGP
jgi:hypothetical protein